MENRFFKFVSIFLIVFSLFYFQNIRAGDITLPNISIIDYPDPFNPLFEEVSILMKIKDLFNSRCDSLTLEISSISTFERIIQWQWQNVNPKDIIEVKWDGKDEKGNLFLPGNYLYNISCFFVDEFGQDHYLSQFGIITLILKEENFLRRIVLDEIKEPLESHKPFDIFDGFVALIDDPQLLQYFFPDQTIPQSEGFLFGKIEGGMGFGGGFDGFGIKIKKDNIIYLLFFYSQHSKETSHLFISYDNGSTWQEEKANDDFGASKLIIPGVYLFWIKTDRIGSFPWEIELLSSRFNIENQEENEIFDQTEKIEINKENQSAQPIITFSPKNPVKGVKVKFDASSSTDADGEIKEFFWEIKRGEEILATSTATITTFTFLENSEYQITLTATDNDGATSSTSTIIKVEPFSFALITDLHIGRGYFDYDGEGFDDGYDGEEYYLTERLKNVINWINENKENYSLKFVAVLGDIADTAEKSEFCKAKEILDKLEIPYIPLFGNHDVWPYTEKESALTTLGENFFERIFWSTSSIPCENASSARNFEALLRDFNFESDTQNPKFKNFAFNFGGIHFIGLDFNLREKACEKECGVKTKGTTYTDTINWLKSRLANFSKDSPIILFSHHPITKSGWEIRQGRLIYISAFSPGELEELKNLLQNYNVQLVLSGHVHGFEKFGKEAVKFSPLDIFFTANWLYSSLPNIPVLTTEALMVGSNENDEVLKKSEFDKGIVRIVKIFDSNNLNFRETAAKYNPQSGKGKEFVALNPYISWAYKFLENSSNPCIFLKSHPFTNRDISSFEWELGNGEKRYSKVIPLYCYSATGTYTITSTVTDARTGWKEWITRKIEIKEGFFSKIIKIKNELKEKAEIISQKIGENLLEFGNYLIKGKDRILLKIKHSPSTPIAELLIDFDEATGDVDLSQMIFDSNLKEKKSILYMPEWPKVVKEKILLLPK